MKDDLGRQTRHRWEVHYLEVWSVMGPVERMSLVDPQVSKMNQAIASWCRGAVSKWKDISGKYEVLT